MTPEQLQSQKNMQAAGLTPEQQASVVAGKGYSVPNATLQSTTPIEVPPTQTIDDPLAGLTNSTNTDLTSAQVAADTAQTQRSADVSQFKNLSDQLLSKQSEQLALEQTQGIPQFNQQLNELQNISRQKTIEYNTTPYSLAGQGRGITTGILRGQEAVKQRQLGIDIMLNNSNIQAMQGNILLAQQTVDRAIAAKYDPIEAKIKTQRDIIDIGYQDLSTADKKLADAKKAKLDLQTQQIADRKEIEKSVNAVVLEAAKNGADATTLDNIRKGKTVDEAISLTKGFLSTPDTMITKLDDGRTVAINKRTNQIVKDFGGAKATGTNEILSIADAQKLGVPYGTTQAEAIKLTGKTGTGTNALKLATAKAKVDQLTALSGQNGIGSAVGTSFVTRAPSGFFGNLGALASVVGIPSTLKGAFNKLTGAQQNFIGDVEQLRSELNLDTLINAKSQGATFGALSDNELKMLASAATKIGTWAMKDSDGNVTGYNTSESAFKKEVNKINNFAKLDYIIKGGDPMDVGAQLQNDGTIWSQNSDGTLTQIK
jgi:hypothetical protein